MRNESAVHILGLLKACAKQKDLAKGAQLHAYIREHKLLLKNCYVASTLVNMYARCGALGEAQQVLSEFYFRDVVIWNTLIAGYTQQGQGEEALKCFDSMQREGHSPDVVTFTCALKACGLIGAASKGEKIHDKIISLGMLEKDIMLGSTLVDMYAKCGAVGKARQLLHELPICNVVTWNALIAAHVQQGQGREALKCFDSMQREGHMPDVITYTCALKACGSISAAIRGESIHKEIASLGMLEKDFILGSALVDMYVRCGMLAKAQNVVHELSFRDVVTWTALIAGYVEQGQGEKALECIENMECEGHFPNIVTFICALKACGIVGAAVKGEKIHEKLVSLGLLEKDIVLGSALVDMYARCGALEKAQQVLKELPVRDVVTWTALIAGYAQHGQGEEALKYFDSMQSEGHTPSSITFICALKACGGIGTAIKGEMLHEKIVSLGILEKDIVLGNALVDMYVTCGVLAKAQQVFNELPVRDIVTWNALIAGYAQQGQGKEALQCFERMQFEGHYPDAVTFICALKACGNIGALAKGEEIHDNLTCLDMLENDVVLGSALVDMYARCGAVRKAQQVLHELSIRDVVTWNALLAGYVQQGQGEEGLKCFDSMQHEGHSPNAVTFSYALKACGSIGASVKGEQIHDKIVTLGLLDKNSALERTLMEMYARCDELAKSLELHKELLIHVATWNALIGRYAQQGQSEKALDCFERMQSDGVRPDSTTIVCVLNACNHSGLLAEAEIYFSIICTKYGIMADIDHYCCMIDLFGRAGKFSKALEVVEKVPSAEWLSVWISLLGACCKWGEVKTGRLAFEHVVHLDKSDAPAYVSMANIYAAACL